MTAELQNGYGPILHPQEVNGLLERSRDYHVNHRTKTGSVDAGTEKKDVVFLNGSKPLMKDEKSDDNVWLPIRWTILDHVICGLIIAPLVVAFWWSLWDLMDLLVFPDNRELSYWVCIAAGCVYNGFAYCLQEWTLQRAMKADSFEAGIMHRLYGFLFGAMTISLWRGVWDAWDFYTGTGPLSATFSLIVSCVVLIPLRAFRAGKSPPLCLCNDLEFEGFHCSTRFSRQYKDGKVLYILDNLFTAWIIHPLYVTMWRGIWAAMDLIIYPKDVPKSIWVTLAFGYPLTLFCYFLQIPSYYLYKFINDKKASVLWKVLLDDVIHVFVHVATIAVWRGWWELFYHYIPGRGGTPRLWLTCLVSFAILALLMTSNSVIGHGCEVDGEEDPAPFYYIQYSRYFLDLYMRKKADRNKEKEMQKKNDEKVPLEILSMETTC